MKKFFLFKRKDVNLTSTTTSDNGEGLDILAVSVDHLAFMTASLGKVNIVFNDATIYEENNLLDGESFKKTSVTVACEAGGEASLIDSIMSFISNDTIKTSVMRFDAVEGKTNVRGAKTDSFNDIVSEIKELPTVRTTQDTSKNTFIGGTSGTAFGTGNQVGDIDFGSGNKPIIDYTEENLTESGGNVTGWTNGGSGGSTYDISTIVGTIPLDTATGRNNNGLRTQAADMGSSDNFTLPQSLITEGEFTVFAVVGRSLSDIESDPKMGMLIQGSAASGAGLTLGFVDAFENDAYMFKFADEKGEFVMLPTERPIIDSHLPRENRRTAYVFLIRRDRSNNIFVYDNEGSLVASADANVEDNNARTDGDFVVKYLGTGIGEKFQGNLARFGVIQKDIGTTAASKLARDLHEKYTPTT
jgi:hypothetical protein